MAVGRRWRWRIRERWCFAFFFFFLASTPVFLGATAEALTDAAVEIVVASATADHPASVVAVVLLMGATR